MLSLYYETAEGKLNHIDLSPDANLELAGKFRDFSSDFGLEIAEWVRFQFSDPRFVAIFWGGGNRVESLLHAYDILHKSSREPSKNPLVQSVRAHPPSLHESMRATLSKLPGVTDLAEAYAFLAFFKGHRYACEIPAGFAYQYHWLRTKALPDPLERVHQEVVDVKRGLLPWGGIVMDLIREDPELRLGRDEDRLMDGLRFLRKYVRDNAPSSRFPEHSLPKVTDLIIEGLIDSGLLDNQQLVAHRQFQYSSALDVYQLPEIERITCQFIGEEQPRMYLRTRQRIQDRLKRHLLER